MLHFPSTLISPGSNGIPRRSDGLNATQQKPSTHQIFLDVEEELHDARRVHSDGQDEDLRAALNMVINRVTQLSTLLTEAYKSQADLEVQLNVAKSNLQLVISNNEMLEEALRRDTSGNHKDLGWRRVSSREEQRSSEEGSHHSERNGSIDSTSSTPATSPSIPAADKSFFRFRFTGSAANSRQSSRPGTPSSVLPSAGITSPTITPSPSPEQQRLSKELEALQAELEKERIAHSKLKHEKEGLESELESLSQALFEEANKMVATERIKLAETEEELREAVQEKEALRSALRLIEGQNLTLRFSSDSLASTETNSPTRTPPTRSRSSSQTGIKSLPTSPEITKEMPLSPSQLPPLPSSPPASTEADTYVELEASPWVNVASGQLTPGPGSGSPLPTSTIYGTVIYSTHQ